MNVSAKSGLFSTLIGISVSIFGAIIQFLLIYWFLHWFGTEFNGFIRISLSLSFLAGSVEGALGISTVILLLEPIAKKDWISANEIISTSRKKYIKSIKSGVLLMTIISIIYPLEIILAQNSWSLSGFKSSDMSMALSSGKKIQFWKLMLIILIFGFKEGVTAKVFGVYENIMQAHHNNGLRKAIILISDLIVYSLFFLTVMSRPEMDPLLPFLIILIYPFLRGTLMMWYVKKKCPWLKYYSDFDSYKLKRLLQRQSWILLSENILLNADIIIILLVLGKFGLKTSSILSLYLIVGLNIRIIITNFIVSFREYFITVLNKEGRIQWDAYSKYEFYVYIVCGLTFIIIAILPPYIVSGIFGNVVKDSDLTTTNGTAEQIEKYHNILVNGKNYILTSHNFSILYAFSTVGVILYQSQVTILQAKRRMKILSRFNNISVLVFVILAVSITLLISRQDQDALNLIEHVLIGFYVVKTVALFTLYINMWIYSWKYLTYNSSSKNIFGNIVTLLVPIVISILVTTLLLDKWFALSFNSESVAIIGRTSPLSLSIVISIIIVTFVLSFFSTLIVPFIIRPSVALAILKSLVIVKSIIRSVRRNNKDKLFSTEGIEENIFESQNLEISLALKDINSKKTYKEEEFDTEFDSKPKPKIYKLKGTKVN